MEEKISSELIQQLKDAPKQKFDLIIRTDGDASRHKTWLASEGFEITRQFRMVPGFAVTAAGEDALRLQAADWVLSVELDAPMQAFGSAGSQ
ncbi:MAG: hypothetical protein R3264_11105 [Anaerolineae bacterium]|nr:hypothetical protein [Anaerolineae bacterium]